MQKLSRTDKYREYRNKLNNDGEREIATKELRELQEKIIFNEKRFGNSSKTETDLNRGRKDTSYNDIFGTISLPTQNQHVDDLNDVFAELNRYKRYSIDKKIENTQEHDDYIRKIKDIVNKASSQDDKPEYQHYTEEKRVETEKAIIKEEPIYNEFVIEEEPVLEKQISFKEKTFIEDLSESNGPEIEENIPVIDKNKIKETSFEDKLSEEKIAEFVEEPVIAEPPKSQLDNVEIKKPDIQPTIPQTDHSKEFEEICMNANSLAEKIESANSFSKDQYVSPVSNHKPINSFEGIQQNIKKDLIGSENEHSIFDDIEKELFQFKTEEKDELNDLEYKKKIAKKSELSEQIKKDYDNTVSLQVDKLMDEIKSSKSDNISAADIIKGNDIAKKELDDNSGKTIAFEVNKKNDVPDNTIVLSKPSIDDSSIHTMSFKTEDLDMEENDNGNTILNVILSILIIIAVGALGVIIYFFLLTRGII